MTRSDLLAINRKLVKLDDKYDVNNGGCCFVAAVLAKQLQRLGIVYKLVIFDRTTRINKITKATLHNNIIHNNVYSYAMGHQACSHYAIYVPQYDITLNEGDFYEDCYYTIISRLSVKSLNLLYETGDWNTLYDTDNNQEVKNAIEQMFIKFKNHGKIRKLS